MEQGKKRKFFVEFCILPGLERFGATLELIIKTLSGFPFELEQLKP